MGINNPFEIAFVFTAIILIVVTSFGIIAPSIGISVPEAPQFPIFPDLNGQGNQSASYAFNETQDVFYGNTTYFYSFNPDKRIEESDTWVSSIWQNQFIIQRYGTWFIIPTWYGEPISFMNGTEAPHLGFSLYSISPQTIVDNFNGTYSSFIIDKGHFEYEAYVSFSPLAGSANISDSWNTLHGFTAMMYGNSYGAPSWSDQIVAYLSFFAGIIGYLIFFAGWLVTVSSTFFTILGLVPSIASGIIILVVIVFIGSILMYIRGGSGK